MRLEYVPVIVGLLIALAGLGLIADAWLPEPVVPFKERRRRVRAERSRPGEALLGLGALAMAAALIGRDAWGWSRLAVLLGAIAFVAGVVLNRHYLHELLFFRGPARRAEAPAPHQAADATEAPERDPMDRRHEQRAQNRSHSPKKEPDTASRMRIR